MNFEQHRTRAALRDTLLPKLQSGEIQMSKNTTNDKYAKHL